jgi:hypothetical protein
MTDVLPGNVSYVSIPFQHKRHLLVVWYFSHLNGSYQVDGVRLHLWAAATNLCIVYPPGDV